MNGELIYKCFKKMSLVFIMVDRVKAVRPLTPEETSQIPKKLLALQEIYGDDGLLAYAMLCKYVTGNLTAEQAILLEENEAVVTHADHLIILEVTLSPTKLRQLTSTQKDKIFSCLLKYLEVLQTTTKEDSEHIILEKYDNIKAEYGENLGGIAQKMFHTIISSMENNTRTH